MAAPLQTTPSSEYRFGSFRLIPRARELWQGDELIRAQRLVFDCLKYLIEHRDRVVGMDELMSALWGRVDVADAQVRQLIARARALVDDNPADQRAIRAAPGGGYRWVAAVEPHAPALAVKPITAAAAQAPPSVAQNSARPAGQAPDVPEAVETAPLPGAAKTTAEPAHSSKQSECPRDFQRERPRGRRYDAKICVNSNTRFRSSIALPVTFTVGRGNRIFANGFEQD